MAKRTEAEIKAKWRERQDKQALANLRLERKNLASRIREQRSKYVEAAEGNAKATRNLLSYLRNVYRKCGEWWCLDRHRMPQHIRRHDILTLAKNLMVWANASYRNPCDSEYYSACGYDDYMADRRREARRRAFQLLGAARALLKEGK